MGRARSCTFSFLPVWFLIVSVPVIAPPAGRRSVLARNRPVGETSSSPVGPAVNMTFAPSSGPGLGGTRHAYSATITTASPAESPLHRAMRVPRSLFWLPMAVHQRRMLLVANWAVSWSIPTLTQPWLFARS